jgi:hypothetical protein
MVDHHVLRATGNSSLQLTGQADFWHPTGSAPDPERGCAVVTSQAKSKLLPG